MNRAHDAPRAIREAAVALTLTMVLACSAPTPIRAGTSEILAGWEGDSFAQGYAFLGAGRLLPVSNLTSIPVRLTASYLYYDFREAGTITRVTSPGLTLLAGPRYSSARGSFTLLAGAEVRREHREPDAAAVTWQTVPGVVGQVEADYGLVPRWRGTLLANYAGAARYVFTRAAIRWQATNPSWSGPTVLVLGLEGTGQGNDESRAAEAGAVLDLSFVPQKFSLAARGGYKDAWSPGAEHRRGICFGLGLYHRF